MKEAGPELSFRRTPKKNVTQGWADWHVCLCSDRQQCGERPGVGNSTRRSEGEQKKQPGYSGQVGHVEKYS